MYRLQSHQKSWLLQSCLDMFMIISSPILLLIIVNLRIIKSNSTATMNGKNFLANYGRPEFVRLPRSIVSNFWWKMLVKQYMRIFQETSKWDSFFKEAKILNQRKKKERKKCHPQSFDHRKFLKAADHISRFQMPKDRAEAILRVLG